MLQFCWLIWNQKLWYLWSVYWFSIQRNLSLGHTRKAGLWMYGLDTWTLDAWMLGLWTLGIWMHGLWTLGPRKFYWFLVTFISLLLIFTVEFSSISNALWLMCYVSVEIAMNSYYNANLFRVKYNFSFKENWLWNYWNIWSIFSKIR